ncbi:MAG: hypothetical protein AYK18_13880 [Theionarchaea archaeon DG-70]|nr:MAG: hypothetical protein AYK18_13880 [Theionarchaea archaeon DG-70]
MINRKMEKKNEKENETANTGEKVVRRQEGDQRGYFKELFNFACVLRGEVKHLEKIKEYIVQEYVDKGLVKLIRPTYEKEEIYIVTDDEWKEYQKLKEKDETLIGYGFM